MTQLGTHLATTCKGDVSAVAYYNKMKGFADEMAAAGKPLKDDDFISYVLVGLDHDYNSFVENVIGKTEGSLGTLYSQFLAAEARLELKSSSTSHPPMLLHMDLVAIVVEEEAVEVLLVALEGVVITIPLQEPSPSVSYARRLGIQSYVAGSDLITILLVMRRWLTMLMAQVTMWTLHGTLTQGRPTMSRASWTNLL
jgi:hypothetical protein